MRHAENTHRPCNVLQLFFAQIVECRRQSPFNLFANLGRDIDVAGLRQCLQPRGYVDAIPVNVPALADDVPQVDANAQDDMIAFVEIFVGLGHLLLKLDRGGNRVYGAGEFDENPIPHEFDDAPLMAHHGRLQNGDAPVPKDRDRSRFVAFHERRIADNVRDEDRGKTSFGLLVGHICDPKPAPGYAAVNARLNSLVNCGAAPS